LAKNTYFKGTKRSVLREKLEIGEREERDRKKYIERIVNKEHIKRQRYFNRRRKKSKLNQCGIHLT